LAVTVAWTGVTPFDGESETVSQDCDGNTAMVVLPPVEVIFNG
jgi:hypothetical protein